MRRILTLTAGFLGAALVVAGAALAGRSPKTQVAVQAAPPGPPGIGALDASGLFRHTGAYSPVAVGWAADGRLQQVLGVFPHPVLPERAVVATRAGVLFSDDAGGTWQPLSKAAADQVGNIRHVEFSPDAPDTFYLASNRKGVWATKDGGKTVEAVGSKQAGMAADETVAVYVYPGDRRFRTLLAIHGEAAPGISYSRDRGHTWRVAAPDYHVRSILCGGAGDRELFLVASKKGATDVQSIYYCVSFDDYWLELVRDLIPTDTSLSLLVKAGRWNEEVFRGATPIFSTADAGLYRVNQGGGVRIGPADINAFASVGFTWGPNADTEVFFAYEPRKLGMMVSTDGLQTFARQGEGLYTGPFVKEGARIRANANGTVFYATANEVLYVGRRSSGPLEVSRVAVTPPIFIFENEGYKAAMDGLRDELRTFANERYVAREAKRIVKSARDARAYLSETQFTVTATVTGPGGPPASVTVDLSRIGGSGLAPMLDDGQHGDGAAGDGLYGATFRFDPRRLKNDSHDWRRRWPGRLGLTVTAAGADGALSGAVAVLAVFDSPESFTLHKKVDPIAVTPGPWSQSLGASEVPDILAYYAMTFWIKSDMAGDEDVQVQLRDAPPFSFATTTPPAWIVKEALVEGGKVTSEWRLVTIPLARLLKDSPQFETMRLGAVVLSGESKSPRTYWVDEVRFHISREDLSAYKGANSP